jgi:glucose-6-phosphate 1-epimerase
VTPGLHSESVPVTSIAFSSLDGATAEVHWNGAHVTSWRPAQGKRERLFLSSRTKRGDGVAIRGGIPIIFPQFSTEGPLPRHGFARTSRWEMQDQTETGVITFTLRDSDATRAIWPASFLATLTVRISGQQLATTLSVENTGQQLFHFTAALHTYLRVDDIGQAEIVGLHGGRYRVSSAPGELRFDNEEVLRIEGEMDRVYVDAPPRLTLREPGRELTIESTNFPDAVIWNPGAQKAAALDDMEPGGERRMVCIEAGAIQSPVTLEPARTWSATQTLSASVDAVTEDVREVEHSFPALAYSQDARQELALKLQHLEEFVARAESSGEELPSEAVEVVNHLREIMRALDGLTKELDH